MDRASMTRDELRAALEATCPQQAQTGADGVCRATITVPLKTLQMVREAAEHHLATLPRTKMVEMWHCESAVDVGRGFQCHVSAHESRDSAEASAAVLRVSTNAKFACIRVTGPHSQEVPA